MTTDRAIDRKPWRVGRKVGRTIYQGDTLIGMMDTPELARRVVDAVNADQHFERFGITDEFYEELSHDQQEAVCEWPDLFRRTQ